MVRYVVCIAIVLAAYDHGVVAKGPSHAVVMPDLRGMTRDEAIAALRRTGIDGELTVNPNLDCTDDSVAKGRVCYQSPVAGAQTLTHSPVTVFFQTRDSTSNKPGVPGAHYKMPDVIGLTVQQARDKLRAAGFSAKDHIQVTNEPTCRKDGVICRQDPAAGEETQTEYHKVLYAGNPNDTGTDWAGPLFP